MRAAAAVTVIVNIVRYSAFEYTLNWDEGTAKIYRYLGDDPGVVIPEGVTTIGYDTFHWCESLGYVTLPDTLVTIGDESFAGCTALEEIVIPEGVTTIGDNAFDFALQ